MNLKKLIQDIDDLEIIGDLDKEINKIENNSSKIAKDDLFIAIRGANFDGHKFIEDAIKKGANSIIVEEFPENLEDYKDITFIKSTNTRDTLAKVAAAYYDHPSKDLTVIGVTGTKGKTTTVAMIKKILDEAGIKCATIGTHGIIYDDRLVETSNTTPDPLEIQKAFRTMVDEGYTHVALEASSIGFKQKRLESFDFDIGVFLNLAKDHVGRNEHESFEEYIDCKREIFDKSKVMIANKDPEYWDYIKDLEDEDLLTFSTKEKADYYSEDIDYYQRPKIFGVTADIKGKVDGNVKLIIPGEFNISNALAALAVADQLGIDSETSLKALENFQTYRRAQLLEKAYEQGRTILADYAHNKLSVNNFLKSLQKYKHRNIIVLYSYEYYEVPMRRYDMGISIGNNSDYAVLTTTSTGNLSFEEQFGDTIKGLEESGTAYKVIKDHTEAIQHIMDETNEDDIIVFFTIADEYSKTIDDQEIFFSEDQVAADRLKEINNT